MKIILLSLFVFLSITLISSRGIWGSKKKREEVEEKLLPKQANDIIQQKRSIKNNKAEDISVESLSILVNAYLDKMEEFSDSSEFIEMLSPDSVQLVLSQIPGISTIPEVKKFLSSDLNDPIVMQAAVKEGLKNARDYSTQFVELLKDPKNLKEIMKQIPDEYKLIVENILKGDLNGLESLMSSFSGLSGTQKNLFDSLVNKNSAANLVESTKEIFSDSKKIEEARLQFLENADLAAAFGITPEVLNDKSKWEVLMRQGLAALDQDDTTEFSFDSEGNLEDDLMLGKAKFA